MTVFIGADPGTSNFAYSILDCKGKSVSIIEIGMFIATITNLTRNPAKLKVPKSKRKKNSPKVVIPPFLDQFSEFQSSWSAILKEYKPKKVTVERFQSRGYQGSAVIEAVSMMNGILSTLCFFEKVEYENHIAGTWKNDLNKYLATKNPTGYAHLEEIYEACKPLPNHIIDSVFINLYGVTRLQNKKWPDLNITKLIKDIQKYEYVK